MAVRAPSAAAVAPPALMARTIALHSAMDQPLHYRGKIAISIAIKIGPAISTLHYLKIATKVPNVTYHIIICVLSWSYLVRVVSPPPS